MKKTSSEYIRVENSKIHNKGVFAAKNIPRNTKIIEYVGEKITKKESEKRSDKIINESKDNHCKGKVYIFELNKKYDLDGSFSYNTARLINHSCKPNCEAVLENGRIFIYSIKNIKEGRELTYDYGYDVDNYKEHPCRCKRKGCVGYIVARNQWRKLKLLKIKDFFKDLF